MRLAPPERPLDRHRAVPGGRGAARRSGLIVLKRARDLPWPLLALARARTRADRARVLVVGALVRGRRRAAARAGRGCVARRRRCGWRRRSACWRGQLAGTSPVQRVALAGRGGGGGVGRARAGGRAAAGAAVLRPPGPVAHDSPVAAGAACRRPASWCCGATRTAGPASGDPRVTEALLLLLSPRCSPRCARSAALARGRAALARGLGLRDGGGAGGARARSRRRVTLLLWLGACSARFLLAGELRGAAPRRGALLSRLWRPPAGCRPRRCRGRCWWRSPCGRPRSGAAHARRRGDAGDDRDLRERAARGARARAARVMRRSPRSRSGTSGAMVASLVLGPAALLAAWWCGFEPRWTRARWPAAAARRLLFALIAAHAPAPRSRARWRLPAAARGGGARPRSARGRGIRARLVQRAGSA